MLGMDDGQAGVDSVAVMPLDRGKVLLLGLEPHGGASNKKSALIRHQGHPQDKRAHFWQALPAAIREADVIFAMVYITHDELSGEAAVQVLEHQWESTAKLDGNAFAEVNLLLMDRSGLERFLGPLWPLYEQVRYMRGS